MTTSLTIVILKPAATFTHKGYMPDVDVVNQCINLCQKSNINVKFIIADDKLLYAMRKVRGENFPRYENIIYDGNKIEQYPKNEVVISEERIYKLKDISKNKDDPIIYILTNSGIKSSYYIMSLINDYTIKNRYFFSPLDVIPLVDIVTNYINGKCNIPYKLYDGEKFDDVLISNDVDYSDTLNQIMYGCRIVVNYLGAGFDKRENNKTIESWTLNPETPFIKGCIYTYSLFSPVADQTPILQITTNSGYRKQLFEIMTRVISNFAINNNLLDINKIPSWDSPEPYKQLMNIIEKAFS